jgi:hypothetical protein
MMIDSTRLVRSVGMYVLTPALLLIASSCTNLTEAPNNALTPETAFQTDAQVLAGMAGIYAQLRPLDNNVGYMSVEGLPTDEIIVPTRGGDWFDNGQWLDMHRQTWTANSGGTLTFLNGTWNDIFSGVAKSNLLIDVISKAASCDATLANCNNKKSDSLLAELRTLRAFDYYMLQNLFGGVPLVTGTSSAQVTRTARKDIFAFVEKELIASRDKLPKKWPAAFAGRVTSGAANAILASLYLNAGVFTKETGVNATGYNSCSGVAVTGGDACAAAIAAANLVINSGVYTLNPNWATNFGPNNQGSPENIFVIAHTKTQDLGTNWPMRTLHYSQIPSTQGGAWNGFSTTAETYAAFTPTDDRRGMWLAGAQVSFETGLPVNDRAGKPLVFTAAITDAAAASEGQGIRFNKFAPLPFAASGSDHPDDFTIFRLAEMYLIKAEAENESGQTAQAVIDLNFIHNKHDPSNPVTAATQAQVRDAILKERQLELSAEGKRRADMIRFGKFLNWTEASANGISNSPRDAHYLLFAIPAPQIASNPLLSQNPGY